MKMLKEIQKKGKKHKIEKEDLIFAHSRCCGSHWKLIFDNTLNAFLLVCNICGNPIGCRISELHVYEFYKDPCKCGCENFALFSQCCKAYWELCYNRATDKTFIMCEICGSHAQKIKINYGFTKEIECEHCNPKFNRKNRDLY